ncbi:MAG: chemotaxis-specific methylesterase [Methanocella sp. PtaU1.Bin125]|nr:MAG: chemotaxis-specific methylesterase [Methanocella sp. PtaU1.Bin125]
MEMTCDDGCQIGIAIVEDEKDLVDIYKRVFARHKIYVCFVAYNGFDAIKKFIECTPRPHVVLMDHRLPGMSGIEVTREILKIDPAAKIVFLSADYDVKNEALRAGAAAFLKKPVSIRDILKAINDAITGK